MSKPIINGIDLSKYFKNHYDSWGRLYCIEYKGNPLELQNDIKRLQEENEGLKSLNDFNVQKIEVLKEENEKLYKALEEMRKEANRLLFVENPIYGYNNSNYFEILAKHVLAKTNEVLEDNENVENDKL